uniref:Uncharacterized protein n=1 Tax=Lutzomyia longipalpis TaxID=7200 RepID=A0A1B0CCD5_LUTLO
MGVPLRSMRTHGEAWILERNCTMHNQGGSVSTFYYLFTMYTIRMKN